MRYISVSHLQEGMVLARPIYGSQFETLLSDGMILGSLHIQRINELGYAGVYILDEQGADTDEQDIIPAKLRLKTIKAAKKLLTLAESGSMEKAGVKVSKDTQYNIVMPVIEAIIANKRRIVDKIDLKPFDNYNYYHASNVVVLSLLLGIEMGISGNQLFELGMAALLHDVGTIFIPKTILQKPGRLTPEEYDNVKRHTEMGFQFLRDHFDISIEACIGALQHHENFDGSGYPNKLKKSKISIYGRIIAITNVYDALVSRRPFRKPMFPPEAMNFMQLNAGKTFDPEIVNEFQNIVSLYPTGVCVELNSGVCCLVVQNYAGSPARPRLRLLNRMSQMPMYIDLHDDPAFNNIKIERIIELPQF